jgi:hypothetical protein
MRTSDSLTFELSDEQEAVLSRAAASSAEEADASAHAAYRAWNAHFVAPETPLEGSYRAWNAHFVAPEKPVEQ